MAGKWEFHGRKVGETRLGTQTEINNNKNVKVFHITTEIRGGSEGRQAMTMMTDDSVIGGTVGIENSFEIFQSIYIIYILYI